MQIFDLMDSLQRDLEKLFEDNLYEAKGQTDIEESSFKKPQILQGWYTEKKNNEDFPYIMISPVQDETTWEENVLEVILVFASFGFGQDAWKDAALMANEVKRFFVENYAIANKFPILKDNTKPLKIEYPDQQPFPEWYCFMKVRFNAYNGEMNNLWRGIDEQRIAK